MKLIGGYEFYFFDGDENRNYLCQQYTFVQYLLLGKFNVLSYCL